MEYRRLKREETDAAAALHRLAGATIPGYDVDLHTPEQDRAFYAGEVWNNGAIWSAWDGERLVGHVATSRRFDPVCFGGGKVHLPGLWIDHLYVDPAHHRRGIGRALVERAEADILADDLQLWTFQANARARAFYAALDFAEEELTDGAGNEERQPDVRLRWRKQKWEPSPRRYEPGERHPYDIYRLDEARLRSTMPGITLIFDPNYEARAWEEFYPDGRWLSGHGCRGVEMSGGRWWVRNGQVHTVTSEDVWDARNVYESSDGARLYISPPAAWGRKDWAVAVSFERQDREA